MPDFSISRSGVNYILMNPIFTLGVGECDDRSPTSREGSVRTPGLALLILTLIGLPGCSSGRGDPAPSQPTNAAPTETKPAPPPPVNEQPEPEPEPEPGPGELVNLRIPKDGGAWPWTVGVAPPVVESRPMTYRGTGPYAANGFAVRPEVSRAVISRRVDPSIGGKKGAVDPRKLADLTRVAMYDTSTGQALPEWIVPGSFAVLDLSPDGRSILATHPQYGRERSMLRLWVIGADGQLKRWQTTAHTAPRDGLRAEVPVISTDIRWAAFVGERVVSMSRAGQLRVFDTEGLKPLATIDATPCRPAITPDGTKLALLVGPSIALVDPQTRKVVGTRWIGQAPPHPVLRFSPDGTKLAIGGNGRVVILSLITGQFQNVILPRLDVNDNGVFDKPFGWAGDHHLLADSLLFDPHLSHPVWEYSPTELLQFRGREVWAITRVPGSPVATLRSLELPAPGVLRAVNAIKAQSGVFALHPGSAVKIDVGGVPEDRRADARQALEQRAREVGFTVDEKAAVTLVASVDSPGTKPTVVYSGLGSYSYTKKPARLRIVYKDKELWNDAWAVEPPFAVDVKVRDLADQLGRLAIGQPDYRAFSLAPLPTHLPGPNAPSGPLGATDLAATPVGK
jgi:hypothetical protein